MEPGFGWTVWLPVAGQLAAATVAGGLIGLERTYNGRAAGFRTFSLVAIGSCLPMLAASHPGMWPDGALDPAFPIDPTRVMQGIVTGVGFLGAGVIFRDGFSVRGLTTAACVWVVSSIGMLFGIGLHPLAAAATLATLGVLALFRRIEALMPGLVYAYVTVRFRRNEAPGEASFRARLEGFGLRLQETTFRVNGGGDFEYRVAVSASRPTRLGELVESLRDDPAVTEFRVAPTRD
ncbi:MAG TPA: MgtC/SapB family protein [Burkholderiaceae bacterium]|nr:MgtC/SapB family protein [Burkholderiaceae bacterium]